MDKYNFLLDVAKKNSFKMKFNEEMKNHTSFKIGGKCDVFLEIANTTTIVEVLKALKENDVDFKIIGNGSNILVSDEGLRCAVIKLCGDFNKIKLVDEEKIVAGSAVKISKLCNFALKNSLSGLEFAYGIPGSVGGAVYMNAGAYGGEMKDVVYSSCHLNKDLNIAKLLNSDLDFSYRNSIYSKSNDIITEVCFKLKKADNEEIRTKMRDLMQRRKNKQPLEYPSAGSTFKRPTGYFAAALIEECGLKGKSVGDAQVSEKHSGFVVNKGNASCSDVIALVKHIQAVVKEKKGVSLQPEIRMWD